MPQHMTFIRAMDHIAAIPPMNGETTWLNIRYGHETDQIHMDRVVAEQLRDAITQALTELDEIEQVGVTKDQRKQAARNIVASRHLADLPEHTQRMLRNQLATGEIQEESAQP